MLFNLEPEMLNHFFPFYFKLRTFFVTLFCFTSLHFNISFLLILVYKQYFLLYIGQSSGEYISNVKSSSAKSGFIRGNLQLSFCFNITSTLEQNPLFASAAYATMFPPFSTCLQLQEHFPPVVIISSQIM